MIKVIIADDESAVHEQLCLLIPWDELGWEVVGHAYNGEEAKQLVETYRPNLVLTDIKMPLMDGLSFMKWLDQSGLNVKVIVLSGYGDFEFSRSAFMLGAYDYLLKPVNEAELLVALSKAVEQIRKDSRSMADRINDKAVLNQGLTLMRDEFFSQVIGTSALEENEMIVQADQLLIQLPVAGFSVVLINFIDMDEYVYQRYEGDRSLFYYAARNIMNESIGSPSVIVSRNLHRTNEFMFLYPQQNDRVINLERLRESLLRCLKLRAIIGASPWKQRPGKLPAAYAEARHALESIRIGDAGAIAHYSGKEMLAQPAAAGAADEAWADIGLMTDMLLQTGTLREGKRLLSKLDEAFREDVAARMSLSEWKKAAAALIGKLEDQAANEEAMLLVHEARVGVQELRINQVKDLLRKIFEAILQSATGEPKAKSGKQLVEAIKLYIDANYRTVSLEEIAQRFYLNKNYFCSLFKGVTGESFIEYLTALRMEQAKRLLAGSELKTYEIADLVGYGDQRYFSQVFRKHTGLQPTHYRQTINKQGTS